MRRRRRAPKEIAFSFDAFLDLVANVVGIILRLILVAWVGARTYKAVVPPLPPPPALADPEPLAEPSDPRWAQLGQRRAEIARQGTQVSRLDAQQAAAAEVARGLRRDLEALVGREQKLLQEQASLKKEASAPRPPMGLAELQARSKRLQAEADRLRKLPVKRQELRYRTPISAPVTEEVMFECKGGRVTLIDTGAMLAEVKRNSQAKSEELRTRWQVTELTSAVGAFRLRYTFERERGMLDGPGNGAPGEGMFRYGLSSWEVVPVLDARGEAGEAALASGSDFRRVIDGLEPQQTAVTLWVYPDSFPLYRVLRDFLHDKDLVVAGRPLPDGVPIASSRQGTTSRGQ